MSVTKQKQTHKPVGRGRGGRVWDYRGMGL